MANNDKWVIAEADDKFLTGKGANKRERIFAAGFLDSVPPWRIGEVCGYGAGKSSDPEKLRQQWTAAVSRAAKDGGSVVPRIQGYIDSLEHFRDHGKGPKVCNEHEVREKLSDVIRSGANAQVVSAAKAILESYRRDGGLEKLSKETVIAIIVARVGLEKAFGGVEALAPNLLYLVAKADPAVAQARELEVLHDANTRVEAINQRVGKLELEAQA